MSSVPFGVALLTVLQLRTNANGESFGNLSKQILKDGTLVNDRYPQATLRVRPLILDQKWWIAILLPRGSESRKRFGNIISMNWDTYDHQLVGPRIGTLEMLKARFSLVVNCATPGSSPACWRWLGDFGVQIDSSLRQFIARVLSDWKVKEFATPAQVFLSL